MGALGSRSAGGGASSRISSGAGPRRVGGGDHANVANDRKNRLPRQRQPLAEMRADPVGHELARHDEVERAAVRLERAELGGLQPAVEGARAKIAAKSGADRIPRPLRAALRRAPRPVQLTNSPHPLALVRASLVQVPLQEAKGSRRARPESRALGLFSLLPPARIRARKGLSVTVRGRLQVPFFHRSEIMRLDIGNWPKVREKWRKTAIFVVSCR